MLHHSLREWLDDRAAELDRSSELSHALLLKLAQANLFRIGIAPARRGQRRYAGWMRLMPLAR